MGERVFSGSRPAPELLDVALAQNRYFDVQGDEPEVRDAAKSEADAAEQAREKTVLEALRSLAADETLVGDDLIRTYGDMLNRFGETYRLRRLEEMCEIGDRLIPGEVFFAYDGTVMKIAVNPEEGERSVASPRIIASHDRLFGSHYRFAWQVPVEGIVGPGVLIDSPDVSIGREEVKKELDAFHTGFSSSVDGLLGTAADYALVDAAYQTETFQLVAADMAAGQLIGGKLMSDLAMAKIINSVDSGYALDKLVDQLARRFVRDDPDVTDLHHLRVAKVLMTHEQGRAITPKEACNRYLDLEQMGKYRLCEQVS